MTVHFCSHGGDHVEHIDRPATRRELCLRPATHRWRPPGVVEGHWNYRCEQHAAELDPNICTVEPLAGAA